MKSILIGTLDRPYSMFFFYHYPKDIEKNIAFVDFFPCNQHSEGYKGHACEPPFVGLPCLLLKFTESIYLV